MLYKFVFCVPYVSMFILYSFRGTQANLGYTSLGFLEACAGLNLFIGAWFLVTPCTKCYHPGYLLAPSVSFLPFHTGTKGNLGELAWPIGPRVWCSHTTVLWQWQCSCCKCLTVAESDHHEFQYYAGHRVGLETFAVVNTLEHNKFMSYIWVVITLT